MCDGHECKIIQKVFPCPRLTRIGAMEGNLPDVAPILATVAHLLSKKASHLRGKPTCLACSVPGRNKTPRTASAVFHSLDVRAQGDSSF